MNGAYALADTPEERLAIAVLSANEQYDKAHPQGVRPGAGFYRNFLAPFLRKEVLLEIRMRRKKGLLARAELEMEDEKELMEVNQQIEDLLHGRD
jgi:hypothetical protein